MNSLVLYQDPTRRSGLSNFSYPSLSDGCLIRRHYWSDATSCTCQGKDCVNLSTFGRGQASAAVNKSNCGPLVVRSQTTDEQVSEKSWSPLGVDHKVGDVVAGKYRIIGVLGQGGVGTTYEAEIDDGSTVALKAMSLRNMKAWKDLELFEREARVLKSLRHPSIPEYIDYFEVDSPTDRAFYIAQKVAKGSHLADLVLRGWRVTEEEVIQIALEVLEVLGYLGSLRPPVYHRDIKPENVILDEDTNTLKVVDFGAVQDAASLSMIGSTVVGTYGYMAPEQFQNRATSQTDLYGLGGTLLFLLSGRSPSAFSQKRLKVDFSAVTMSPRLAAVIDKLLEPAPEDRFQSPSEVIEALKAMDEPAGQLDLSIKKDAPTSLKPQAIQKLQQPAGTKVDLQRLGRSMVITIPPVGLNMETAGTGTFTVAWNAFLAIWTRSAFSQSATFALFSLPFWFVGIGLARKTLSKLTGSVILTFVDEDFVIEWCIGSIWKQRVGGKTRDIISAEVFVEETLNQYPVTACQITLGVNVHKFGSGLELVEKNWIVQEIRSYLGLPQQEPFSPPIPRFRRRDARFHDRFYDQFPGQSRNPFMGQFRDSWDDEDGF